MEKVQIQTACAFFLVLLGVLMAVAETEWYDETTHVPLVGRRCSWCFEILVFAVLTTLLVYSIRIDIFIASICAIILGFHAHQLVTGCRYAGGGINDRITLVMHLLLFLYCAFFMPIAAPIFACASLLHIASIVTERPFLTPVQVRVRV